ncbi:MAG: phenylacetic acid degradation protein [Acidobacteriota bacterium]
MPDTQWPRFEVFLIEEDGKPAEHVGSVHAPDREMALLNARDVFVRRPRCRHLWVVPSAHVLFRTAEELMHDQPRSGGGTEQRYLVFAKPSHREPLALWECLSATSAETALAAAVGTASRRLWPLWAVFPEAKLTRSDPEAFESFFTPAETKHYKMHSDFPTARQMKEIRRK